MAKSTGYSWRFRPDLKLALEEAARQEGQSIAELLERISQDWLARSDSASDEKEQRRLQDAVSKHLGVIAGGDPDRSIRVREKVRARLSRDHGRSA